MDPSVLGDKAQTGTLLQLESGSSRPLEFVAVGHVTLDEQADSPGWCVGGAALYAASAARSLGLRAGIVTAAGVDFPWAPLSELAGSAALGNTTTRFQNDYHDGHRRQRVLARAEPIEAIQITRLKRNQTIADDHG